VTNKELRAAAREQLGGGLFENNWLMALLVSLLVSAMTGIAGWLSFIIVGALMFGSAKVFLGLARGKKSVDIAELFDGFRNFGETFILGFMMTLFVFLWTLLFIIPGIIMGIAYSMCFYIKNDHPEYDWKKCLDESRRMMDGHKAEFFVLQLSFIGWILLGALCCGIGTLWVQPYIECTNANYYEDLKRQLGMGGYEGYGYDSGCFGSQDYAQNADGRYYSPFTETNPSHEENKENDNAD